MTTIDGRANSLFDLSVAFLRELGDEGVVAVPMAGGEQSPRLLRLDQSALLNTDVTPFVDKMRQTAVVVGAIWENREDLTNGERQRNAAEAKRTIEQAAFLGRVQEQLAYIAHIIYVPPIRRPDGAFQTPSGLWVVPIEGLDAQRRYLGIGNAIIDLDDPERAPLTIEEAFDTGIYTFRVSHVEYVADADDTRLDSVLPWPPDMTVAELAEYLEDEQRCDVDMLGKVMEAQYHGWALTHGVENDIGVQVTNPQSGKSLRRELDRLALGAAVPLFRPETFERARSNGASSYNDELFGLAAPGRIGYIPDTRNVDPGLLLRLTGDPREQSGRRIRGAMMKFDVAAHIVIQGNPQGGRRILGIGEENETATALQERTVWCELQTVPEEQRDRTLRGEYARQDNGLVTAWLARRLAWANYMVAVERPLRPERTRRQMRAHAATEGAEWFAIMLRSLSLHECALHTDAFGQCECATKEELTDAANIAIAETGDPRARTPGWRTIKTRIEGFYDNAVYVSNASRDAAGRRIYRVHGLRVHADD